MTAKLLSLIPSHHTYVELFGGGAALLFAKQPSPVEVYNDLDEGLVEFFRVLRDVEQFNRFRRMCELTPYSRAEFNHNRRHWRDIDDPVERAYRWFTVARWLFAGNFGAGWGYARTASSRGMAKSCSKWLSAIEALPDFHARIMRVQIECDDFRKIICNYDTPETFFYCDPPYVASIRSAGKYRHEMSDEDHAQLVKLLLGCEGKILLSGYANEVYRPLERAGWQRLSWQTACHAAGRTRGTGILGAGAAMKMQPRTETVWISPNCKVQRELRLAT